MSDWNRLNQFGWPLIPQFYNLQYATKLGDHATKSYPVCGPIGGTITFTPQSFGKLALTSLMWFDQNNVPTELIEFMKWWCCVVSNKCGRVSALLGPHQHALGSM